MESQTIDWYDRTDPQNPKIKLKEAGGRDGALFEVTKSDVVGIVFGKSGSGKSSLLNELVHTGEHDFREVFPVGDSSNSGETLYPSAAVMSVARPEGHGGVARIVLVDVPGDSQSVHHDRWFVSKDGRRCKIDSHKNLQEHMATAIRDLALDLNARFCLVCVAYSQEDNLKEVFEQYSKTLLRNLKTGNGQFESEACKREVFVSTQVDKTMYTRGTINPQDKVSQIRKEIQKQCTVARGITPKVVLASCEHRLEQEASFRDRFQEKFKCSQGDLLLLVKATVCRLVQDSKGIIIQETKATNINSRTKDFITLFQTNPKQWPEVLGEWQRTGTHEVVREDAYMNESYRVCCEYYSKGLKFTQRAGHFFWGSCMQPNTGLRAAWAAHRQHELPRKYATKLQNRDKGLWPNFSGNAVCRKDDFEEQEQGKCTLCGQNRYANLSEQSLIGFSWSHALYVEVREDQESPRKFHWDCMLRALKILKEYRITTGVTAGTEVQDLGDAEKCSLEGKGADNLARILYQLNFPDTPERSGGPGWHGDAPPMGIMAVADE